MTDTGALNRHLKVTRKKNRSSIQLLLKQWGLMAAYVRDQFEKVKASDGEKAIRAHLVAVGLAGAHDVLIAMDESNMSPVIKELQQTAFAIFSDTRREPADRLLACEEFFILVHRQAELVKKSAALN